MRTYVLDDAARLLDGVPRALEVHRALRLARGHVHLLGHLHEAARLRRDALDALPAAPNHEPHHRVGDLHLVRLRVLAPVPAARAVVPIEAQPGAAPAAPAVVPLRAHGPALHLRQVPQLLLLEAHRLGRVEEDVLHLLSRRLHLLVRPLDDHVHLLLVLRVPRRRPVPARPLPADVDVRARLLLQPLLRRPARPDQEAEEVELRVIRGHENLFLLARQACHGRSVGSSGGGRVCEMVRLWVDGDELRGARRRRMEPRLSGPSLTPLNFTDH